MASSNSFSYYWINATNTSSTKYTVVIPEGYYDVHEFNSAFEKAMYVNGHYLVYTPTGSSVFLMKIVYNNENGAIEIQTQPTSLFYGNSSYIVPTGQTWTLSATSRVPIYFIPATGIQSVIGFSTGYYPELDASGGLTNSARTSAVGFLSNTSHSLRPNYSTMYYKPSNPKFATQGGVSSSDLVQRVKYQTIVNNGATFTKVFGAQVGNAMSYGVLDQAFTVKAKLGYPIKKTPIIDKYTGELKCRENGRLSGKCASDPNG
jgi:hypothetical protein